MKPRSLALFLAAVMGALAGAPAADPAFAQSNRRVEPPSGAPLNLPADRAHNLDFLFEALKVAPDERTAKAISNRILGLWLASGGDTTNLLMSRVRAAIEKKELDLAIQLLDSVIEFKPEYIEGWDQRATVYYLKKDFGRALGDLAQVLAREPRHFGAMFGLGIILQEFGDDKRALEIYRRALAIDPHMQRVPDLVKTLSEKLDGRDI
jgi:tetratricopeptide (TPR) repeat protein